MFIIILILILINFIYNITGIYYIIPFIIRIINFAFATFNLIGDPTNLFYRIVQASSLFYLLFIIYINLTNLFI